jgi:hypothetical protein
MPDSDDLDECLFRVGIILEHFFLRRWSPQVDAEAVWRARIEAHRAELKQKLTPALRPKVENALEELHNRAAHAAAHAENDSREPLHDETLRWALTQVLGEQHSPFM